MAAATTSGPCGLVIDMIRWSSFMSAPSGNSKSPVIGVSMEPGHTALALMPRLAYSTASTLVSASTPPLEAE